MNRTPEQWENIVSLDFTKEEIIDLASLFSEAVRDIFKYAAHIKELEEERGAIKNALALLLFEDSSQSEEQRLINSLKARFIYEQTEDRPGH